MNLESNGTCSAEEVKPSTLFLKVLSGFLVCLIMLTLIVLSTLFCLRKKSSGLLRSRANVLTYIYVFGSVLQMFWAIDSLMDRKGFPCLILSNLLYFIMAFQVVPRSISAVRIYFKLKLNRQLATFELVSALNLRGDTRLSHEIADDLIGEGEKKMKNVESCGDWRSWYVGCLCDSIFGTSRRRKALRETLLISERFPGVKTSVDVDVAMEHFPSQHVLFLSSKRFAIELQLFFFLLTFILLAFVNADEALCTSPCDTELKLLPHTFIMAIILAPLILYYMYKVKDEPDPLGIVWELRSTLLVGLILGAPTVIFVALQPGDVEEGGRFRWALFWVLGSWIEILLSLGFPLYLATKNEHLKQASVTGVSLHHVLESKAGRDQFKAFLIGELSVENYLFWKSVKTYKEEFDERSKAENFQLRSMICQMYVTEDAQFCVNISAKARNAAINSLEEDPTPNDFDEASRDVHTNMASDSFIRFKQSTEFKRLFSKEEADDTI